ncbi:hypothetical protein F5Y16DRAFT_364867 [Xylariaceae sp. FL0255]|nr:hypothetical protein F5Y16DRAFT_364867 [Xylariaceae sp. FL0255]
MHRVYETARKTVVFLNAQDNLTLGPRPRIVRLWSDLRKAHVAGETDAIKSWKKLFEHPWFCRAWVVQEISVSRSQKIFVIYGQDTVSWSHLRRAASLLRLYIPGQKFKLQEFRPSIQRHQFYMSAIQPQGPDISQIMSMRRLSYHPIGMYKLSRFFLLYIGLDSLTTMLHNNRYSVSTDPRDQIFSLMNIHRFRHHRDHRWLIEPDYGLSVGVVYTRAARYCIETDMALEILSFKGDTVATLDLPSWAPDWTSQRHFPISQIACFRDWRYQFHPNSWPHILPLKSTMNKRPVAQFHRNGKSLVVRGYKLDILARTSQVWESALEESNEDMFHDWEKIFFGDAHQELSARPHRFGNWVPYIKAPRRSIFDFWDRVGRVWSQEEDLIRKRAESRDDSFRHPLLGHLMSNREYRASRRTRISFLLQHGLGVIHHYHDWLATTLPYTSIGRRVAATKSGFFALVPATAQQGECVYFLQGGGYPGYILRKHTGREALDHWYELIGCCYIHGLYGIQDIIGSNAVASLEIR